LLKNSVYCSIDPAVYNRFFEVENSRSINLIPKNSLKTILLAWVDGNSKSDDFIKNTADFTKNGRYIEDQVYLDLEEEERIITSLKENSEVPLSKNKNKPDSDKKSDKKMERLKDCVRRKSGKFYLVFKCLKEIKIVLNN
jgi:hypothetical protein